MQKTRFFYVAMTILLLIIEVGIALFVHDNFIRPYIGDVLVVVVIYAFIRSWIPEKVKLLPLYIFIFATGVEILQYFEIVKVLGLEQNAFIRTIIGSTFDGKDIICYGAGCLFLVAVEKVKDKK
ncbi:MAG: DUF2809 domain-containing protein [Lachnospiraceae bacterium]|nr:DUF2809 domain-containing protein [Lachnospiraceae bacterium]